MGRWTKGATRGGVVVVVVLLFLMAVVLPGASLARQAPLGGLLAGPPPTAAEFRL
jgi:hypothetical protein